MKNQFDDIAKEISNFTNIYAKFAQQYNLNINELRILYFIYQNKTCLPKEISHHWNIPAQTVSSFCSKFVKKGYLKFSPNFQDKRQKTISYTQDGLNYFKPIFLILNSAETEITKHTDPEQMKSFIDIFSSLSSQLNHLLNF